MSARSLDASEVTKGFVRPARLRAMPVFVWTVTEPALEVLSQQPARAPSR
jgi:hypothetical protein